MSKNHVSKNLYELLESSPSASFDELRKCYQRLTVLHHPDRSISRTATLDFVKIKSAWETLKEAGSRSQYDQMLQGSPNLCCPLV